MKRLLIVGSAGSAVQKYCDLIDGAFDEVLLVAGHTVTGQVQVPCKQLDFSFRKLSNHWKTVAALRQIIIEFRPDIVHVHQANSYAYFTARALKGLSVPLIITAWGSDVLLAPSRSWLIRRLLRYALQRADALTSVAGFMVPVIRQLAGDSKREVMVSSLGVVLQKVKVDKEKIIYSNRLHKPLYCIDKVISAFEQFAVNAQYRDWRLVIAGTGPETDTLKRQAAATAVNDRIDFVGWVDSATNALWYSKATIYLSIPESDGAPVSLLEAMRCGAVPVVSDLPANREWITSGENGLLVNDFTSPFLADALALDQQRAAILNSKLIDERADATVCREKFLALYATVSKNETPATYKKE